MHKINEANRELAKQQDAARQAMAKLEAEGKKGSKEWQNLNKSVKDYGEEIKSNKEKIKELDKQLDLSQRSVAELSKILKNARNELRNTSKATDSQLFELGNSYLWRDNRYIVPKIFSKKSRTDEITLTKYRLKIEKFHNWVLVVVYGDNWDLFF